MNKEKNWKITEIERNRDNSCLVTIIDEEKRIGTTRCYTMSPSVGRALPSNINELARSKSLYERIRDYLFG